MNSNVWAKTILSVYPYLENLASAIDRIVERRALNSFYVSSTDTFKNNIYDVANKLIELSERKIVLINLKILTEETLKSCDRLLAKILIAKYFSKKTTKEICEMFSIPARTFFRKVFDAEVAFEKNLKLKGYDDKKLNNFLKDETWIFSVKEEFKTSKRDVCLDIRRFKSKVAF